MADREKVINKVKAIVADMQEEVDEWKDYSDSELRGGLTCDCDWWYKTLQTLKDTLAVLKMSFTPQEVYETVIEHGQHDKRFKLGDKIDYSFSDVVDILNIELMCKAGDNVMADREKVINGLECCAFSKRGDKCEQCQYFSGCGTEYGAFVELAHDALALLKAQEPRVMTLGDLRDIGSAWELDTPPYLWMEINPSYRWAKGFWVAWREIYDMIDGLHPTYDADNYGKIWRCWTSRPTDEQRQAVKWK